MKEKEAPRKETPERPEPLSDQAVEEASGGGFPPPKTPPKPVA